MNVYPNWQNVFLRISPDWKWIIVGEGNLRHEISREIEKRNLQGKLILAGEQNPFEYYCNSEFLVAVSRYEGMPLVLLEALNCYCPVIAFDCKHGPADIVKNDINGYLVEAENFSELESQIKKLMRTPDECRNLSKNASDSVIDFSIKTFIEKWEQIINQK